MTAMERIGALKLVPVAVAETLERAEDILSALETGGLLVAEMTFRTDCAAKAIRRGRQAHPDMLIGAGTVLNGAQCEAAIAAGAQFIVGPGFSAAVAAVCRDRKVPYLPGCVTPTEIMAALDQGIDIVKFFPAGVYGGVKALSAIGAAFPKVRFVPTGGVDAANLSDYLALKNVYAVGGSWMLKGAKAEMTDKVRAAVALLNA